MIKDDDRLILAATLRARILELLDDVPDASNSRTPYVDPAPNWKTRKRLLAMIFWFEDELRRLGGMKFYEFAQCGSEEHPVMVREQRVDGKDYWLTIPDHLSPRDILFDERGRMTADGVGMECSEGIDRDDKRSCPCGGKPIKGRNAVRVGYAIPFGERGPSHIEVLANAIERLYDAAERADGRAARSSLREAMLWALRDLEAVIMPQSVEDYLSERRVSLPYRD